MSVFEKVNKRTRDNE